MTIQLNVRNEDSRRAAVVKVQAINTDGTPTSGGETHEIHGGQDCTIHVHSGQSVRIDEIRNG